MTQLNPTAFEGTERPDQFYKLELANFVDLLSWIKKKSLKIELELNQCYFKKDNIK